MCVGMFISMCVGVCLCVSTHTRVCEYVLVWVDYGHYHLGDFLMLGYLGNRNQCSMQSVLPMELGHFLGNAVTFTYSRFRVKGLGF